MASTDFFCRVGTGTATTLAAPGHAIAGTTFNVGSTAAYPTTTGVFFAVDTFDTLTGKRVPGSYTVWQGDVINSTTLSGCVLRFGTDQNYTAGSTTRVYMPINNARENRLVEGLLISHSQDGKLLPAAVQTALGTGNLANTGFNALGFNPNTVTYNGNRSYTCVFNGTDLSTVLSAGMRIRTTRTVAAPTQSTSLNGTTQFWSKTAPAGMTFTDDFTCMGWVKLSSYGAGQQGVISRFDGTNGWALDINPSGTVRIIGITSPNSRAISSFQSVPLNKWVHIAATLDMSANTGSIFIDGVLVPSTIGGTATALIQAGNLQVGAENAAAFFPGKIAQAGAFSAVLSQATIQSYYSQGLTSTAPSLVSAYSFDGNATDLNTTNANNLTATAAAGFTADGPFGGQANGTVSSTLDYGIVQKVDFATNTTVVIQVAEGCTIPTTGGVTSVAYSSQKAPYGFPSQRGKWTVEMINRVLPTGQVATVGVWYNNGSMQLVVPVGEWQLTNNVGVIQVNNTAGAIQLYSTLSTTISSEVDTTTTTYAEANPQTSFQFQSNRTVNTSLLVSTIYYELIKAAAGVAPITLYLRGDQGSAIIRAENALL